MIQSIYRHFKKIAWHGALITLVGVIPTLGLATTPGSTASEPVPQVAYTYQTSEGNKLVSGRGNLPETRPLDIPLQILPQWVVAIAFENGSVWTVTSEQGEMQQFRVINQEVLSLGNVSRLSGNIPAVLDHSPAIQVLPPPTAKASLITHPIVLPSRGQQVFIEKKGDLVFFKDKEVGRLSLNALPDARILMDDQERLLLLTSPTERYGHGVLGDAVEAASMTLVQTKPTLKVLTTIEIRPPDVIEGIAPLWTDLNGDGQREIIATLSNDRWGAQLVVFNEKGQRVAESDAIGRGYRWRHQLAVAPFGPKGEMELVGVLTPHLGRVVEFFQWQGNQLVLKAALSGYTSHTVGSRNLDMALAGDFDGDQRVELLLPNSYGSTLGAIQRTDAGAKVIWKLPVGGRVTTNVAAAQLADNSIVVGVGHDGNTLRLWGTLPLKSK